MKSIFLLIICSFYFSSYGQEKTLFKTWSGKDLEYIKIDSNLIYFEMSESFLEEKRYFIIGDTLRLYDKYTTSRDNFSKYHIDNFDFFIKKLTTNELTLIPLDSNAKELSKGKKELNYIDRNGVIDRKFRFKQLKYHIYGGAWGWIDISMSIDNKRNFEYINKSVHDKPEYFYSSLSADNYNELIKLLKSSEIDKLKAFEQSVSDIAQTTLEIEFNGKSKQIKQFILPAITTDIISFISKLPMRVSLKAVNPFQIKFKPQ
jgi:acetolactate synthase small subunit